MFRLSNTLNLTSHLNRVKDETYLGLTAGGAYPNLVADFQNQNYQGESAGTLTTLIDHNSATAGNATMTGGYGPELVTNGGFDADSDWTKGTGWAISGGAANYTADPSAGKLTQSISISSGSVYAVTFTLSNMQAGSFFGVRLGGTTNLVTYSGVQDGTYTVYLVAEGVDTLLKFATGTGGNVTIDNISVREIPKVQWRPHNLLTYSEDFSDSDWAKTNTTVTANAAVAPDGTTTADEISHTTSSASITQDATVVSGVKYTVGVFYKNVDAAFIRFYLDGASVWIDTSTNTVGSDQSLGATVTSLANGWFFFQASVVTADTNFSFFSALQVSNGSGTEEVGTSAYIWGAHLYRSDLGGMADVPAAERVLPDATTYVRTAGRETTGVELVTNGTFDTDTTGWTGSNATLSVVSNELQVSVTANGTAYAYQVITTVAGRVYAVTADFTNDAVNGNTFLYAGTSAGSGSLLNINMGSTTGTYSGTFVATGTTTYLSVSSSSSALAGESFRADNISVKEIDVDPSTARYLPRIGHHVYNGSQWVNEGLLHESEARTNLLDESNDFSTFSVAVNLTVTDEDATSPDGQVSATTVVPTATSGEHYLEEALTSATGTFTDSVYAKADGYDFLVIRPVHVGATEGDTQTAVYDLSNGTIPTEPAGTTALIEDVGNGWYRCSLTYTISGTITGAFSYRLQVYSTSSTAVFSGDTTSGIAIYGAQREAASTPSSYIPTSGSTVTRAAETLTIEHENLPWPSPYVIGDELVTNGTFDSDLTGWTDFSEAGGSVSQSSSGLAMTTGVDGTQEGKAYQIISTVAGNVYRLTATKSGASSRLDLSSSTQFGAEILIGSDTTADVDVVFVATTTTTYLNARNLSSFNSTAYIDNISVKEINPLSVSIAMDGRMTYADTNSNPEATLVQWREDSNNRINYTFTTASGTGDLAFQQVEGGTFDQVAGGGSTFNPDTLVPFSFASRHGSTFVNGAYDGVALTADTTPTALPDLETTDLNLGHLFMGTIGTFRIWANDIGDDGLVEATEPSDEPSLSMSFDGTESSFVNFNWSE